MPLPLPAVQLLYLEWGRAARCLKRQPLWLVRKYFGDKIAMYFAWLGFYTKALILPSCVGLFCFFYGLMSMDSADNTPRYAYLSVYSSAWSGSRRSDTD